VLAQLPEAHAEFASLVEEAASLPKQLAAHSEAAGATAARLASLSATHKACAAALAKVAAAEAAAVEAARRDQRPRPPGSRTFALTPLTSEQEAVVDGALAGGGNAAETLAEFQNIPVTRKDMATLRPMVWLNDEVINLFMKLIDARSQAAVDATLPKCYFTQTNFYTKLAEGPSGYSYASVKRWTKKVDVFSKDLVIVPIHCHGNHWTLAVINFKARRFEYYDSLRGSEDRVLEHLRRWLADEHQDKKKAAYDTSEWTDVSWKSGTPQQRNGSDCGVFMTRTADYLARDALLDFTQADMEYFRRRMVYEIMSTSLLP
jgi:sentrin-specific protease 1